MSNPSAWGLLTSFGEASLGVLLLHAVQGPERAGSASSPSTWF